MNVNQRELSQHVEFEPNTYYAAFSAELEASAYPMWALVSHLADESTVSLTRRVLSACLSSLLEWLDAINFTSPNVVSNTVICFNIFYYFSFFRVIACKCHFTCHFIGTLLSFCARRLPNKD